MAFMIQKQEEMILSLYSEIYDLVVPKENFLRRLDDLVDFSFVYNELEDKCKVWFKDGCYKPRAKSKTYSVTIKLISIWSKQSFRKRMAIFTVNLKQILKLMS